MCLSLLVTNLCRFRFHFVTRAAPREPCAKVPANSQPNSFPPFGSESFPFPILFPREYILSYFLV
jgi:hypothetical protein